MRTHSDRHSFTRTRIRQEEKIGKEDEDKTRPLRSDLEQLIPFSFDPLIQNESCRLSHAGESKSNTPLWGTRLTGAVPHHFTVTADRCRPVRKDEFNGKFVSGFELLL